MDVMLGRRPTWWWLAKKIAFIDVVALSFYSAANAASFVFSNSWSRKCSRRCYHHGRPRKLSRASSSSSSSTGVSIQKNVQSSSSSPPATESSTDKSSSSSWIREGLLLSSFTDGLAPNPAARACLQRGLVRVLLQEKQRTAETTLASSVVTSPCCGPNTDALGNLESVDWALERLASSEIGSNPLEVLRDVTDSPFYTTASSVKDQQLELRMVYIPTAMYALRPESNNTPGKQRQRARADGKKRRNEIVKLLQEELPGIPIRAVTLDFDDESVKQPESTIINSANPSPAVSAFPKSGEHALGEWKPHLVYVQGGNTFWLYHCLEKGNWRERLVSLLEGEDTFYCGASAGAILVGASMQTACWKGWDDPRVVPGMETYDDWQNVAGLRMCGTTAFFPHYVESEWSEVVRNKGTELKDIFGLETCCMHDDKVCLVDGAAKQISII